MKTFTIAMVYLALTIVHSGASSAGEMKQNTTMHLFEDLSIVENATAELTRMDHGVYMNVRTNGLVPGHAVTMWYVVFNKPELCSDGECGENDVFNLNADGSFIFNDDGSPPINGAAWEAASISLLRADGLIVGDSGVADFRGHLPVGDVSEAVAGPGLLDAMKAEVHAVLRDHMAPENDEAATNMLTSLNGGCGEAFPNEPCVDPQFAVFKPAS